MFVAGGAQAQTPACDQLKNTLAARIDPSIRGFTLETVAGDAPVPPGAKVIGTCEVNAYKILFRRGGDTRPAPFGGNATAPALKPAPAAPTPPPNPPPAPAAKPVPTPAPPPPAAPPPAPKPAPERVSLNEAVMMGPMAPPSPPVTAPAPRAQPDPAPAASAEPSPLHGAGFMARHWQWIVPLVSVPLLAWAWLWYVRRRDYDEAGLPRGPRL